jgi:hypothetical protein
MSVFHFPLFRYNKEKLGRLRVVLFGDRSPNSR